MLYTPVVVLWAWISQVLDSDKSLSNAVKRVTTSMAMAGEAVPSGDTGAYSKARKRLPFEILPVLLKRTASSLQEQVSAEQRWCGRVVKAFDGTRISISDTSANQKSYPQPSSQKEGCGFLLARLMAKSLASQF